MSGPVELSRVSTRQLDDWNPPPEAEPVPREEGAPSVLSKLQKWGDYESVGLPVAPTRFVPMKTPMSSEIITNWSLEAGPRHALTVPSLLVRQAAAGAPVGLIIDLANHECLYGEDIPEGVEYAHVTLVAKVLPPREAIDAVQALAEEFWRRRPDAHIAIHCAYGFNRTGFVVCAYLCQACGLSVEEALESFAAARPPGVKHEKFVNELYARYGGGGVERSGRRPSAGAAQSGAEGSTRAQQERQQDGPVAEGACALPPGRSSSSEAASDATQVALPSDASSSSAAAAAAAVAAGPASARDGDSADPRRRSFTRSGSGGGAAAARPEGGPPAGGGGEGDSAFTAMAIHLEASRPMRRQTSLGLARALTEDFQMHEGTPGHTSPLEAGQAGGAAFPEDTAAGLAEAGVKLEELGPREEAAEAEGCPRAPGAPAEPLSPPGAACRGGGAAEAAAPSLATPGARSQQRQQQQRQQAAAPPPSRDPGQGVAGLPPMPRPRTNPGTLAALARGAATPLAAGGTPLPLGGTPATCSAVRSPGGSHQEHRSGGRFQRTMSVESDNQSLGFGAREALMHLRGNNDSPPPGGAALEDLFRDDSHPDLSGLEPANFARAGSVAASGQDSPPAGPTTRKQQRQGRGRRRLGLCRVM